MQYIIRGLGMALEGSGDQKEASVMPWSTLYPWMFSAIVAWRKLINHMVFMVTKIRKAWLFFSVIFAKCRIWKTKVGWN